MPIKNFFGFICKETREFSRKTQYPISCREGEVKSFLAEILELYALPNTKILDPTCGEKIIWDMMLCDKYNIFFSDIKTGEDYKRLNFQNEFPTIVFDPPYLFGIETKTDERQDQYGGYIQSKKELDSMIKEAPFILKKYLTKKGIVILKCSDLYLSKTKKFYCLHYNWILSFLKQKFKVLDCQVFLNHRISPTAFQVKDRRCSVQNHTYFIIFELEK